MAEPRDIVDWSVARRVGRAVAGPGPETTPDERAAVRRDFREFSKLSDELVREFTGLAPAEPAPEPRVLDRGSWIGANIDSFDGLLEPLERKIASAVRSGAVGKLIMPPAMGLQLGLLLGYLSQKVLGQYDLVLAAESGGEVYFVGPNVIEAERRSGLDARDFRLWITLHEMTHRTQFAGVPWLRDKVRSLIARSLEGLDLDPARVARMLQRARDVLLGGPNAWRQANLMTMFLTDEQRVVVDEMQALMCIVEGHGTFVMNRVGEGRIPSLAHMQQSLESRRSGAGRAERVFQRAIGMDMKYEQYALGERFMEDVAQRAGLDAVNRVWAREENLPTLEDLRDPEAWLRRVGA